MDQKVRPARRSRHDLWTNSDAVRHEVAICERWVIAANSFVESRRSVLAKDVARLLGPGDVRAETNLAG